jgi:hypothetical protein
MEAGPSLNGVYANQLGGIPQSRLRVLPAQGAALTLNLAPLGHAEEDGDLLVQIPPTLARPKTYWVEFHHKSKWDRAIPSCRVAIHKTRVGTIDAFLLNTGGTNSLSLGDPAMITPDGSMGIYLASQSGCNATVRIWELGPTHAQEVRIREVVIDPPGDDGSNERVVIRNDKRKNDKRTVITLTDWTLQDERNHPSGALGPFVSRLSPSSLESTLSYGPKRAKMTSPICSGG